MWNMFKAVDFGEYSELLFSPEAPIAPQMMAFNGFVILILLYRWAAKSKPVPSASRKTYKFFFVAINLILFFQRELSINEYLLMITPSVLREMVYF